MWTNTYISNLPPTGSACPTGLARQALYVGADRHSVAVQHTAADTLSECAPTLVPPLASVKCALSIDKIRLTLRRLVCSPRQAGISRSHNSLVLQVADATRPEVLQAGRAPALPDGGIPDLRGPLAPGALAHAAVGLILALAYDTVRAHDGRAILCLGPRGLLRGQCVHASEPSAQVQTPLVLAIAAGSAQEDAKNARRRRQSTRKGSGHQRNAAAGQHCCARPLLRAHPSTPRATQTQARSVQTQSWNWTQLP